MLWVDLTGKFIVKYIIPPPPPPFIAALEKYTN